MGLDLFTRENDLWVPIGLPAVEPPDPDPDPEPSGTWPTLAEVGLRTAKENLQVFNGNIITTQNGQVIKDLWVNGLIRIRHNDVVIDNVYQPFGPSNESNYAIRTEFGGNVGGIRISHVEVAGQRISNGIRSIAMNFPGVNSGGVHLDHIWVHDVGSGPRFYNNCHIRDSISQADWYAGSASHRSGIGNNGGAHCSVVRCRVECVGIMSSAAISLYGDNALCDDHLFQDNLFVAADGYITYGGSVSSKQYPVGQNIRFLNNKYEFRQPYTGPLYGAMTAFSGSNGNQAVGNTWHTAVTLQSGKSFQPGDSIFS